MPAAEQVPLVPALTRAQRAAVVCLRGYQLLMAPLFAGSCRFVPSCSVYATQAVVGHGVVRGSWLAIKRLARCRPLAAYGFDPVPAGLRSPDRGHKRPAHL